jgi:hypothetical protein
VFSSHEMMARRLDQRGRPVAVADVRLSSDTWRHSPSAAAPSHSFIQCGMKTADLTVIGVVLGRPMRLLNDRTRSRAAKHPIADHRSPEFAEHHSIPNNMRPEGSKALSVEIKINVAGV